MKSFSTNAISEPTIPTEVKLLEISNNSAKFEWKGDESKEYKLKSVFCTSSLII